MKKLYVMLIILGSLFGFTLSAQPINQTNIAGTYEGVIVFPTPESLGVETYIFHYELFEDGTLAYTEFFNEDRTLGILGDKKSPACPGTYELVNGVLKAVVDCSAYSRLYQQEVRLDQANLSSLQSPDGKKLTVHTSLYPGLDVKAVVRKLK